MSEYQAVLRMPEETSGIGVVVDLDAEHIAIRSGEIEIGEWPLGSVRIIATDEGFRLRADGEEVVITVSQDAEFAVELGLRSAPPVLRRRMAALLRND